MTGKSRRGGQGTSAAPAALRELTRHGLLPPTRLTLAVTGHCNLRCFHCYVDAGPDARAPAPSYASLCRLLNEFLAVGGKEVALTGGEPLTRADWIDLVAMARPQDSLRRIELQTNATLLGKDEARALAALECEKLVVQVSLEGAKAASHDRVRGAGSFDKTMAGIESLVACGLGSQVSVAFTEMRHNVEELPDVLAMLDNLGVHRFASASVTPHGRAASSGTVAAPTAAQYRELIARYRTDAGFHKRCRDWAKVSAVAWWAGRGGPGGSECDLVAHPYVGADGRVYPCPLLHEPELAAPGAFERPLFELLVEAAERWGRLLSLSARRRSEIPECGDCRGRSHCGGGCMGRAWMAGEGPFGPEDRCDLRRAVYGCARERGPKS